MIIWQKQFQTNDVRMKKFFLHGLLQKGQWFYPNYGFNIVNECLPTPRWKSPLLPHSVAHCQQRLEGPDVWDAPHWVLVGSEEHEGSCPSTPTALQVASLGPDACCSFDVYTTHSLFTTYLKHIDGCLIVFSWNFKLMQSRLRLHGIVFLSKQPTRGFVPPRNSAFWERSAMWLAINDDDRDR